MPLRLRGIGFEDVMPDFVGTSHFKTGIGFSTR